MEKIVEKIVVGVAAALLAILVLAPVMAYHLLAHGFVLSKLWAWFIVPAFGLPALGVGAAIGVTLVATFLLRNLADQVSTKTKEEKSDLLIKFFLGPWIALGIGALVKMFI